MIPELGTLALIVALLLATMQSFFGLAGAHWEQAAWMQVARSSVMAVWLAIACAFFALSISFVQHDFSVAYVAQNSNLALPLLYRLSAVWGAHEGSLLLWTLMLASWALLVSLFSKGLPPAFRARVLGVLGLVSMGFLSFTLLTSNPFTRLLPAALDGADLNPILQDPALAIHPPMLYMGYVGTAVAFAFAVAAMLSGQLDAAWARWTRPWTLAAWVCLTVGIALGSWWAYYELGWGGWWFWDPVENASFMPWLVTTALIHSLAVTEKRGLFKQWTVLLAIFAFSLSLLGTFLVRSGVLVSVHAFAADPSRGLFVLALLVFFIVGALTLYAFRASSLQSNGGFEIVSRESFLLLNNALLVAAAGLILVGTLWPLLMDALKLGKISVGPPYFNAVFLVPTLPLVLLMSVGMHAAWKRAQLQVFRQRLLWVAAASIVLALVITLGCYGRSSLPLTIIGFAAGLLVIGSSVLEPLKQWRRRLPVPQAMIGMALAHIGIGLFVIGVSGVASYTVERDVSLGVGESTEIAGYRFTFMGTYPVEGPNYQAIEGRFEVRSQDHQLPDLTTQKRTYRVQQNPMTQAGIAVAWNRDLFVALGEDLGGAKWSMRLQYKPLIRYLWIGALVMALGGLISLSDRRYRVSKVTA
jgi:cytochrome c-type biogenesis protein CcmF